MRDANYDVKPVSAPRLRGTALRLIITLLEKTAIAPLLLPLLTRNLGLRELRDAAIEAGPTLFSLHSSAGAQVSEVPSGHVAVTVRRGLGHRFRSIRDYQRTYRGGMVTPDQVAARVLAAIADSDRLPRPLRACIACNADDVLSQASEATRRLRSGRVLGPLDGIPITVKDEIDMVPYPTTAGTRFLGRSRRRPTRPSWPGCGLPRPQARLSNRRANLETA